MWRKLKSSKKGFTIIETVLTVSLLLLIVTMSLPSLTSLQGSHDADISGGIMIQSLRRAQSLAQAGFRDDDWGVAILVQEIVLFKGSSYATRDPAFDEQFGITPTLQVDGISEFVFEKGTGTPLVPGQLTITSQEGISRTMIVNAYGMVAYE